jgi:hypothetical protein
MPGMTDIIPVLDVVERIYEALANRFRWPNGLESIARLLDGTAAFLLAGSTSAGWISIASWGVTAQDAAS